MILQFTTAGEVITVSWTDAVAPFTYSDGLKFDALGRLVVTG